MEVVHEVCCGLDVHKKSVTACVLWAAGRRRQTREFRTFTKDLLEMSDWLRGCGVTHVAMESTGVYWKPVWNLLEGQFEVLLVKCAAHQSGAWTEDGKISPAATRTVAGEFRATDPHARTARSDALSSQPGAGDQPHRQSYSKGVRRRQHQVGFGGYRHLGRVRPGHAGSDRERRTGQPAACRDVARTVAQQDSPVAAGSREGHVTAHHRFLLRELLDHHYFVESKMRRIELLEVLNCLNVALPAT